MRSKFFALLTLLAVGSIVANAKFSANKSAFARAPEVIVDASLDADKLFKRENFLDALFSADISNDTLYFWKINWNSTQNQTSRISTFLKRTLNATTLKPISDDVKIEIKTKYPPIEKGALGYIGFAYLKDLGENMNDQLFFGVLKASANSSESLKEIQLTHNNITNMSYNINYILAQNDKFYVLYSEVNRTDDLALGVYLQGINAQDGSLLYQKAIKVASFDIPISPDVVMSGFDSDLNATKIIVALKERDNDPIMLTAVNIADGEVAKPKVFQEDQKDLQDFPVGMFTSHKASGVIVFKEALNSTSQNSTTLLELYFADGLTNPKELALQPPEGHNFTNLFTFGHADGFVVFAAYTDNNSTQVVFRQFDSSGSPLSSQQEIGVIKGAEYFQLLADAKGAIWLGYCDNDVESGLIDKCFLGKVLD